MKKNGLDFTGDVEILKIERPNWEVVEEKKELLTKEEREFLKFFVKHYKINQIRFGTFDMDVISDENRYVTCTYYPENMKFEGVERGRKYTPKELRIGGINNGFRRIRDLERHPSVMRDCIR